MLVAIALSLLTVKINVVLEISINNCSSTDRGEGTSNFKTLRNPEREGEKTFTWQWRNSKEKERLGENGEQGGSYMKA